MMANSRKLQPMMKPSLSLSKAPDPDQVKSVRGFTPYRPVFAGRSFAFNTGVGYEAYDLKTPEDEARFLRGSLGLSPLPPPSMQHVSDLWSYTQTHRLRNRRYHRHRHR
jgi:hypothetical protein